jgi:hypothetical protein
LIELLFIIDLLELLENEIFRCLCLINFNFILFLLWHLWEGVIAEVEVLVLLLWVPHATASRVILSQMEKKLPSGVLGAVGGPQIGIYSLFLIKLLLLRH